MIRTAVRRYLGHPLSATSVIVFLAERGIDVCQRRVLRRVQTFGPLPVPSPCWGRGRSGPRDRSSDFR